jgi:hypothetical protein
MTALQRLNTQIPSWSPEITTPVPIGTIVAVDMNNSALEAKKYTSISGIETTNASVAIDTVTKVNYDSLKVSLPAAAGLVSTVQFELTNQADLTKFGRLRTLMYAANLATLSNLKSFKIEFGNTKDLMAGKSIDIREFIVGWSPIGCTLEEMGNQSYIQNKDIKYIKFTFERYSYIDTVFYLDTIFFTNMQKGWTEMNGQTIYDSDSNMYGKTLEDLNAALIATTINLFIRGGKYSGQKQNNPANLTHTHNVGYTGWSATGGTSTGGTYVSSISTNIETVYPPWVTYVMMIKIK